MKNSVLKLTIFLSFFGFICWVIWQANVDGNNPLFRLVGKIPFHDKLGHIVLYGILAFLLELTLDFRKVTIYRSQVSLAAVIILAFAIVEELTQIWISSRSFDLLDVVGDIVGIAVFIKLADKIQKRKKRLTVKTINRDNYL